MNLIYTKIIHKVQREAIHIFMWKLNQFAGFGLQGKPNDIFQSSLFAEFIKLTKFLYNYIDLNIVNLPEIRL